MFASKVPSRVDLGRADDRLCTEVEHGVDLGVEHRSVDRGRLEGAVHDPDAAREVGAGELGAGVELGHEGDDVGALVEQAVREPRTRRIPWRR